MTCKAYRHLEKLLDKPVATRSSTYSVTAKNVLTTGKLFLLGSQYPLNGSTPKSYSKMKELIKNGTVY